MRFGGILLILVASLMVVSQPAVAVDGNWCRRDHERGAVENCSFLSLQQCLATIRVMGGICARNHDGAEPRDDGTRRWRR